MACRNWHGLGGGGWYETDAMMRKTHYQSIIHLYQAYSFICSRYTLWPDITQTLHAWTRQYCWFSIIYQQCIYFIHAIVNTKILYLLTMWHWCSCMRTHDWANDKSTAFIQLAKTKYLSTITMTSIGYYRDNYSLSTSCMLRDPYQPQVFGRNETNHIVRRLMWVAEIPSRERAKYEGLFLKLNL